MGKKHYMSPEQLLGLPVEAPSDVFSVGVVLFELLTLEQLFTEEMTALAVDEVAINPLPSIRAHLPQIDDELEQILSLALAREPALRPTAAAMGHALDQWCAAQREFGSPDRLQHHLAELFPATYEVRSLSADEELTTFSNLKRAARGRGILGRIFGR
jgi:serine/threonine protein kinase